VYPAGVEVVDSSLAVHVLVELDEAGDDGCFAAALGHAVGKSGAQVGACLRELRCRGLAVSTPVSPASTRVRWYITDAGRAFLDESA